jgi:hypothetical protein
MSKLTATWDMSLDTECPNCKQDVDLLDDPGFWDGRTIQAGEHETDATRDMDVVCPKCHHEFVVDLIF